MFNNIFPVTPVTRALLQLSKFIAMLPPYWLSLKSPCSHPLFLFSCHIWETFRPSPQRAHTHRHTREQTHTVASPSPAFYVVQAIGWISCAIPYGGLSCWIWSQSWMKEPVSHHRFVLPHLSRRAAAHLPPSLRPPCQPTDAVPFRLPRPVVHCLPLSCTS